MIDEKKLLETIEEHCYIVHYGYNCVSAGMTLDGIRQAIAEQEQVDIGEVWRDGYESWIVS